MSRLGGGTYGSFLLDERQANRLSRYDPVREYIQRQAFADRDRSPFTKSPVAFRGGAGNCKRGKIGRGDPARPHLMMAAGPPERELRPSSVWFWQFLRQELAPF